MTEPLPLNTATSLSAGVLNHAEDEARRVTPCPVCVVLAPPFGKGIMIIDSGQGWLLAVLCTGCQGWSWVRHHSENPRLRDDYLPAPFWTMTAAA